MYEWHGQEKFVGMWKEFKDGDLISEEEAKADSRFDKWLKSGVLVSKAKLDAAAKKKADAVLKVAENRAAKAKKDAEKKASSK